MNVLLTLKVKTLEIKMKPLGSRINRPNFLYQHKNSATFLICIIFTLKYPGSAKIIHRKKSQKCQLPESSELFPPPPRAITSALRYVLPNIYKISEYLLSTRYCAFGDNKKLLYFPLQNFIIQVNTQL